MEKSEVLAQIRAVGVVPVLRLASAHDVQAMAQALHSGQIDAIPLPLVAQGSLADCHDGQF